MAEDKTTPTTTETVAETTAPKPKVSRKKQKRSVPSGQVHIQATFNNTIVTFTDKKGGKLTASSAGACGFRGSKKGTAYAAQIASEKAAEAAKGLHGVKAVEVFVKGVGLGRDAAIRALTNFDIQVESIKDVTGIPHGGTRPRKARRA
ncbi:30S ribosomal protein S11 [Candidatus Saccharibacteria bacterium RIFCSPHIGHO2_12_FULL_42_8]|nr:MAG: 30S ribosomal protein S11 [Candidatus Saccharibacteria bacterium RIFCSPHIGHO2_12_FULL_42_8]